MLNSIKYRRIVINNELKKGGDNILNYQEYGYNNNSFDGENYDVLHIKNKLIKFVFQ